MKNKDLVQEFIERAVKTSRPDDTHYERWSANQVAFLKENLPSLLLSFVEELVGVEYDGSDNPMLKEFTRGKNAQRKETRDRARVLLGKEE